MNPNNLRFDPIKEDRGWYFVEYCPPLPNSQYSLLQLSVVEQRGLKDIVNAIEFETLSWVNRYPIPLMVSAFSLEGEVYSLEPLRTSDYLMCWIDTASSEQVFRWELVPSGEIPTVALDREYLKTVFKEIPFKTGQEIKAEAEKQLRSMKLGWWIVFIWAVLVPLGVAILEWYSDLLGVAVLIYAFIKAIIEALRLTGRLPKSDRQRTKEARDLKMRHYYYHCERNPEAFERLKIENFRQEEISRTKSQAAMVKAKRNRD